MNNKRIPIGSKLGTQAILNRYFVRVKKNLGQNFLIDQNVIQGIVSASAIAPGDQVVEIGPGIGSLTEQLLLSGAKVFAYELDSDLPQILSEVLPQKIGDKTLDEVFKIKLEDVLKADFKTDLADFFDLDKPIKVVANLPYYITTPIIFTLAESQIEFASMTLMMQKEVADRLVTDPGTKDYGPLTIAVQTKMDVELALNVSHESFNPAPKVDSAVVVLRPLVNPPKIDNVAEFNRVVKMCFAQRRKTLNNNLKQLTKEPKAVLEELNINPSARPETLTIEQYIALAKALTIQR
ncbi:MAG: 16S rRNA (adenine(1518)-N(6)/adenine(1519)-N(6))-dimethyltransferase RsmA [Lactobacillus sp.]|nr:16S rRNA (adenine(1518)-N(6)/adenine(1519)-N(6))-dimethyltransferase RsmA [Lactobacillus sp.]